MGSSARDTLLVNTGKRWFEAFLRHILDKTVFQTVLSTVLAGWEQEPVRQPELKPRPP
jgi:hypothetical protein